MEKLNAILDEIDRTCDEKLNDDMKKYILMNLWKLYNSEKAKSDDNEIYIIDQNPTDEKVDLSIVKQVVSNLKDPKVSITREDANILLKWTVQNTRDNLSKLGIDIKKHSLDGYCELAQLLSIYPLEQLGLNVTKNTAKYCFDYPYNHAFGTVKFSIQEDGKIKDIYFLIDTTYRQFFIREKCSKVQYYLGDIASPSVGYFVEDKEFARTIMKDGFIELDSFTAKKYGEPFTKVGKGEEDIDYFDSIINCTNDYVLDISSIGELNVNLPK